ncbi:hypothetical protein AURDEDRAFT_148665 [Auricularia subglabra TFB-10046 SS5]|nr:hypothetical protein AURDEDRAFT_148665 [Auricularia subglabra TFB-10046 SS5]
MGARSHHPSVVAADAPAASHYSGARYSTTSGARPLPVRQRSYSAPSASLHGYDAHAGAPAMTNYPTLHRRRSNEVLPSDSVSNIGSLRDGARAYPASMRSRAVPPLQQHGVIPGTHPTYAQPALPAPSAHPTAAQTINSGGTVPVAVSPSGGGMQYIHAVPSTIYHTSTGVSYVPYHSMDVNGQRFTFAYPVKTAHAAPHLSPPLSLQPLHDKQQPYTYGNVQRRARYSNSNSAGSSPHRSRFIENDFPAGSDSDSEYSSMSGGSGRIGPRDPPMRNQGRRGRNGNGLMGRVRKMFGLGAGDANEHSRAEVDRERASLADAASIARSKSMRDSRSGTQARGWSLGRAEYEFRNPGKRARGRNSSR